jgi:hypothetical protein
MAKKAAKVKKYKKGVCPKCGLPLAYNGGEPSDSMYVYDVVCGGTVSEHGCGWTGREWYELKFIELIGG